MQMSSRLFLLYAGSSKSRCEGNMCGITGIWNLDGARLADGAIDRFTDSLAHRGPDGRGTWCEDDGSIALGHRRLAILDLSDDGRQPMSYADGRYRITYNGEVYNFVEIRRDLELLGHVFRSTSDTEVILAAYQQWGEEMLARFNGMWAFAIYDRMERSLFLARDRFGIKPFHYRLTARQFAFASELKAFKHLEGYVPSIDQESAQAFLLNGFAIEGSRRTMLQGVRRLQGGHCAVVRNGRITERRWWNTLDHLVQTPATMAEQAEEFRSIFYDAVRLRLRSDVPVGSCLSGGFDSTAVVCALAEIGREGGHQRQARDWQHTFVATFPGAVNDERAEAEEAVRYAGVRGHFFAVTDQEALQGLDRVLHDFDDVYIGLPTAVWLIYRELRRHRVAVSLDGHGADELMGAYAQPDYLLFHDAPSLLASPDENLRLLSEYRNLCSELRGRFGATMPFPAAWRALLSHHPSLGGGIRGNRMLLAMARAVHQRVAPAPFLRNNTPPAGDDFVTVASGDKLPEWYGPVNRKLYGMFHSDVLPTILRNFDRLSMAHGIEVRMPFMDWRLVRFLFSLPDSSKLGGGTTKRVAREAMRGHMPESIRAARHKIGFNSPMPEWFRGPLKGWLEGIAAHPDTQDSPLVDGRSFAAFLKERGTSGSWSWHDCSRVWPVAHLLWYEREFVKR